MRLLRLVWAYQAYLDVFFRRQPTLSDLPYSVQYSALNADFFSGSSDSLSSALRSFGYETEEHIVNAGSLQHAWAAERGLDVAPNDWIWHIARQQVLEFKPEILFVNPYLPPKGWLRDLRLDCPEIALVVCRYSSPQSDLSRFAEVDLVLSGDSTQVAEIQAIGVDAAHVHHAFDRRVLDHLPPRGSSIEVIFSGQIKRSSGFHNRRLQLIEHLLRDQVPLEMRLLGPISRREDTELRLRRVAYDLVTRPAPDSVASRFLWKTPLLKRVKRWDSRPAEGLPPRIRKRAQPPVFGLDMYRELRRSKITLNVHGDVSSTEANNLRLWEATGVGSCLVTDEKSNMGDLFDVGSEVVTYSSPEECAVRIRDLLANDAERERIADAGQRRTLRDHTYDARAVEVDQLIKSKLGDPS